MVVLYPSHPLSRSFVIDRCQEESAEVGYYGIAAVRGGDYCGEDLCLALVDSTLDKLRRRSVFGSKKNRNFMFLENADVENVDVAMARLISEEAARADWDGDSSGDDE